MVVSRGLPINRIESDLTGITVYTSVGKSVTIPVTALSGTRLEQAGQLVGLLQELLDTRIRRNRLPKDDPDRNTDPGLGYLFHDGPFLVSREVVIAAANWNNDQQRFDIVLELPAERQ